MFESMDRSAFGQFVAALWQRQGWQTQVTRDEGRVFVAVQRPETGEEGLLWAVADGEVGGQQVQQFRSVCDEHDVEEGAIVAAGAVSDHAEKVAAGTRVELLDGEGIAAVLEREGLTDLADQYGGDGGEPGTHGGDDSDESAPGPVGQIRARTAGLVSGVPVVAVVLVVGLVGAGVLFGPSIPFLGGGEGVTAASTAPEDANASLHVTWNAEVTDAVDPNESDDRAYYAPEGTRFVVVAMNVTNDGNETVPLEQTAFRLRANDTTYRNATLAGHTAFMDFPLEPGHSVPVGTAFAVPAGDADAATLVYDQNATAASVAVEFDRDPDAAVNASRTWA